MKEETKTKLALEYEQNSYVTEKADPDDSWDRDNTATEFSPTVLRLGDKGRNWRVEVFDVDYPVQVGDNLFLVVVRYDTGDTFGHNENEFCFIGVYKTKKELEKVNKSIKDGSHEKSYIWTGYFENYRDTEIHFMTVEPEFK